MTNKRQLSMSHTLLPKEEWTKAEEVGTHDPSRRCRALTKGQDTPYLSNLITDIEAEMHEREDLESMIVQKRQKKTATASGH